MPSAAGKRVGRVLAGCSKPEAIGKPGSLPGNDTRLSPEFLHRSARCQLGAHPVSDVIKNAHDTMYGSGACI